MEKTFQAVGFDTDLKQMTIYQGTQGSYDYRTIKKCTIENEEAAFRGKSQPFDHRILGGTTFMSMLGEPSLYVGLRLEMSDGQILGIYVSDRKTYVNTDLYREDHQQAEKINHFIQRIISTYQH